MGEVWTHFNSLPVRCPFKDPWDIRLAQNNHIFNTSLSVDISPHLSCKKYLYISGHWSVAVSSYTVCDMLLFIYWNVISSKLFYNYFYIIIIIWEDVAGFIYLYETMIRTHKTKTLIVNRQQNKMRKEDYFCECGLWFDILSNLIDWSTKIKY